MHLIELTRDEGLDLLATVEAAADQLASSRFVTLVMELHEAAQLLISRLFPHLPPAP